MQPVASRTMLILYLLLLSLTTYAARSECPHPEDCYPCYCEEEDDGRSTLHCNHLTQVSQLKQALSGLHGHSISTLSVWKLETNETVDSDAFKGPSISEVVFSHSKLHLQSPQLVGHEKTLNRITFLSSFSSEDPLETLSLGHLSNLKEVKFEKNDIRVLKKGFLDSVGSSFRSITFDDCKIEELEDGVFEKLTTLTTLFVTDNKITTMTRSMLPRPAEDLRALTLSGNNIGSLSDDFFDDLPSLTTLNLENNNIRTMSESQWSPAFEQLTRLYLEGNPLYCDKNMKWISKKSLPKQTTGSCNTPAKLKGKSIKTLMPADFH